MMKYLAGVLSVIAAGILLIAYGLLSPRVGAYGTPAEFDQFARPVPAAGSMLLRSDPNTQYGGSYGLANERYAAAPSYGYYNYPANHQPVPSAQPINEVRPVMTAKSAPVRRTAVRVQEPRRNWKKTALLIGGATAGGAGLGGIIGGKKGALIGAAIGGGATTIYEATKD